MYFNLLTFFTFSIAILVMAGQLQIEKTHTVEGAKRRTTSGDKISMRQYPYEVYHWLRLEFS